MTSKKVALVIIVVLIATATVVGILHYSSLPRKPADYLPPQIDNLSLVKIVTDREAIAATQKSHRGSVAHITDAAIGYYQAGLTIWISEYESEEMAESETQKMTQAMARFGQGYEKQKTIKVEKITVRLAYPKGETHYFWYQGKRMFYIAPGPLSQTQTKKLIKDFN